MESETSPKSQQFFGKFKKAYQSHKDRHKREDPQISEPLTSGLSSTFSSQQSSEASNFGPTPSASSTAQDTYPPEEESSLPEERIGLFELADPSDATIDIVAVHGLKGDPYKSWSEGETLWLRDFLPKDVPTARVMTFGYDARIEGGSSENSIRTTAEKLLNRLSSKRSGSSGDCLNRPILFICHSLGGIVFKQALILAHNRSLDKGFVDISDNTKAVAFLGVPHQGADIARWGSWAASIAQATRVVKVNPRLVNDLQRNSEALHNISVDSVHRLARLTAILTFLEEKTYKSFQIVDKKSAAILSSNERLISVPAHHRDIAKIAHYDSYKYKDVGHKIAELAREIANSSHVGSKGAEDANETQAKHSFLTRCMETLTFEGIHRRHTALSNTWRHNIWRQGCQWLFGHSEYIQWKTGSNPFLVLSGKPGSGKSVLIYALIKQHQQHSQENCLHFYFDANNSSSAKMHKGEIGFFQSLLHQLLRIRSPPDDVIRRFQESKVTKDDFSWDLDALKDACRAMLGQKDDNKPRTYLFIDALDECDREHALNLLRYLDETTVCTSSAGTDLKVCISRRPYPPIEPFRNSGPPHEINVEGNNRKDLADLIRYELQAYEDSLSEDDRSELSDYILQRANSVFLWVELLLKQIWHNGGGYQDKESFKEMVDQVPTELGDVYRKSFAGCSKQQKSQACQLFQTVLFAKQPLLLEELRHALAFHDRWEQSNARLPSQAKLFEKMLLDLSCGLLTIHHEGSGESAKSIVQVIHQSAREYLLSTGLSELNPIISTNLGLEDPICNLQMLKICMRALEADSLASDTAVTNPFRQYVCSWWPAHARLSEPELSTEFSTSNIPMFMLHCRTDFGKLVRLISAYKSDLCHRDWKLYRELREERSILVILAAEGCNVLVKQHAQRCECLRDSSYEPQPIEQAIYVAARFSLLETLRCLKDYALDVNVKHERNMNMTPLYIASYNGDVDMVTELLGMGARVNMRGGPYRTALKAAEKCKHKKVEVVLLRELERQRTGEHAVAEGVAEGLA